MSISKKLIMASGGKKPLYADDVFSTYVYEGTGASLDIENGIDLAGEGGLVWTKSRTSAASNQLTDTVSGHRLVSDESDAGEPNQSNVAFRSTGYTLTGSSNFNGLNDYVSWTFRKAPNFFDVVTYPLRSGVQGGASNPRIGALRYVLGSKRITSSSWRVLDIGDWA